MSTREEDDTRQLQVAWDAAKPRSMPDLEEDLGKKLPDGFELRTDRQGYYFKDTLCGNIFVTGVYSKKQIIQAVEGHVATCKVRQTPAPSQ